MLLVVLHLNVPFHALLQLRKLIGFPELTPLRSIQLLLEGLDLELLVSYPSLPLLYELLQLCQLMRKLFRLLFSLAQLLRQPLDSLLFIKSVGFQLLLYG